MKQKKKYNEDDEAVKKGFLPEETKLAIASIIFFVLAIFLVLSPFEVAGPAGKVVYKFFNFLFGTGFWLLPLLLVLIGVAYLKKVKPTFALTTLVGGALFLASGLGLAELIFRQIEPEKIRLAGGVIGWAVSKISESLFGVYASVIFLTGFFIISLLIIFETKLSLPTFKFWKQKEISEELAETEESPPLTPGENMEVKEEKEVEPNVLVKTAEKIKKIIESADLPIGRQENFIEKVSRFSLKSYSAPSLELLSRDSGKPSAGDIRANANIIKRTFANFGINVEMDEITIGPSITRYALKPAEGVKLSRIIALQDNLALALAAHPIRIEAPIPGKSLVGIEIPNRVKTIVRLGSTLSEPGFTGSNRALVFTLGRDTAGAAHFADLTRMPHLLIAGSTGTGKSVMIHSLITSLLYRNSPDNLRFIMIDPKRVELTLYNRIPHLLTPVITGAKKSILALRWAATEMERRYNILESESARDINSYHENILGPSLKRFKEKIGKKISSQEEEQLRTQLPESMPYIVIVIDELADIMSTYPREMEAAVVRLAQMSRAVGIHLVVSTQRPSTEVITGLIKANIPARIAMQVPSQIDSRTILDMAGAEKLLGAGDMLFLSGEMSKPRRIQSSFVSEEEAKRVVKFLAENNDSFNLEVAVGELTKDESAELVGAPAEEDGDELYGEARQVVSQAGKASASLLQRRLKVGYARAARLLDMLEEQGIIGPGEGAKPREVYVKTHATPDVGAAGHRGSELGGISLEDRLK